MERKNVIYFDNLKDRSKENEKRTVSISIVFVMTMIVIYGLLYLICNSNQGVIWKSVYYYTILTMFWILSAIKRKPLILTFFADIDGFKGKNKKKRIEFYNSEKALPYFYGATIFFALCSAIRASVWFAVVIQSKILNYNLIFTAIDILTLMLIALEIMAVSIVVWKMKTIEYYNNNTYDDNKIVVLEHSMDA